MTRLISTPPTPQVYTGCVLGGGWLLRQGNAWNVCRQFCRWLCAGTSTESCPHPTNPSQVPTGTKLPGLGQTNPLSPRTSQSCVHLRARPPPVPEPLRGTPDPLRLTSVLPKWKVKGATVNWPSVSLGPVPPPPRHPKHIITIDIGTHTICMECLPGRKTALGFRHRRIVHYLTPKGAR